MGDCELLSSFIHVEFFRVLFGQEAAKCRPDYAKFELEEPPVVLSLEPHAPESSGALSHLGFRLSDAGELVDWQRRLEAAPTKFTKPAAAMRRHDHRGLEPIHLL